MGSSWAQIGKQRNLKMANLSVNLTPFELPTHVTVQLPSSGLRQDGFRPPATIDINTLPRETVVQLCDDFKMAILTRHEQAQLNQERRAIVMHMA
jgi:hypothetical protein